MLCAPFDAQVTLKAAFYTLDPGVEALLVWLQVYKAFDEEEGTEVAWNQVPALLSCMQPSHLADTTTLGMPLD